MLSITDLIIVLIALAMLVLSDKKQKIVEEYDHVKRLIFDYRCAAESADGFCHADDSRQLFSAGIQYG